MDAKYKTELCKNIQYLKIGKCSYGKKCKFAHGIEELRSINDVKELKFTQTIKYNQIVYKDNNNINLDRLISYIFN